MSIRAILWDLDGTLLDTLQDLARCMNRVLQRWRFPAHEVDAYRRFVGDGMENLVRRALPAEVSADPAVLRPCTAAMREEYAARWHEATHPYEGIPELLESLRGRGIQMAVLSNKPHDFTCRMVDLFFPSGTFEIVLGERPGIPRKPHPGSAFEIAEKLRIPPDEFLYLGDTDTDMQTAQAAGMFAVGVLWGFRGAEELLASGAQVLIRKPSDLLQLLR